MSNNKLLLTTASKLEKARGKLGFALPRRRSSRRDRAVAVDEHLASSVNEKTYKASTRGKETENRGFLSARRKLSTRKTLYSLSTCCCKKVHLDNSHANSDVQHQGRKETEQEGTYGRVMLQFEALAKEAGIPELAYFIGEVASFRQMEARDSRRLKFLELCQECIDPRGTLLVECVSRRTRKELMHVFHLANQVDYSVPEDWGNVQTSQFDAALGEVLSYATAEIIRTQQQHHQSLDCLHELWSFLFPLLPVKKDLGHLLLLSPCS
uniref:Uncharacterized protein n=1 Tax=Heterosigma akashiwo TaxID=2829 RepID=A0A7S3UW71_HETAK